MCLHGEMNGSDISLLLVGDGGLEVLLLLRKFNISHGKLVCMADLLGKCFLFRTRANSSQGLQQLLGFKVRESEWPVVSCVSVLTSYLCHREFTAMGDDVHSQTLTAQSGECKKVHPPETYTLQVNTKVGFWAPRSTFGVGRASMLTASRDLGPGLWASSGNRLLIPFQTCLPSMAVAGYRANWPCD